jgi:hypothetical protein
LSFGLTGILGYYPVICILLYRDIFVNKKAHSGLILQIANSLPCKELFCLTILPVEDRAKNGKSVFLYIVITAKGMVASPFGPAGAVNRLTSLIFEPIIL